MYETFYGIYDHNAKGEGHNPLASIAMHRCENITDGSMLEEAMEGYLQYKILEHWGLSWDKYISQPREIVEMQRRVAEKAMGRTNSKTERVERQINRELGGLRQKRNQK